MIPHSYFEKVKKYFNGDAKKTWEWWRKDISAFGKSPLDLIADGKSKKIQEYIDKHF